MNNKIIILSSMLLLLCSTLSVAQIKVGDNPLSIDDGSILEIESSDRAFVLPRLTIVQRNAIPTPLTGAVIYNKDEDCIQTNVGTPATPEWQCLINNIEDADHQQISLDLNTNIVTLERGGSIDLTPYLDDTDTDDQTIDEFALNGSILSISIDDDGEDAKTIDLGDLNNNIYTDDGTLLANRTMTMDGKSLTFDGTGDVIIKDNSDVGIGTNNPAARLEVAGGAVKFSEYGGTTYKNMNEANVLAVDADGDVIEMNTAQNTRIFYPPPVVIDASSTGSNNLNLYSAYTAQFGSPLVKSNSAPESIYTYGSDALYYYITDYDTSVLTISSISDTGVMSYTINNVPTTNCTFINVVFVIK